MKIALMCFSTARLVRKSASPIAALLLPVASSASTSRSRGVSSSSGESDGARALGDQHVDDLGVDHGAAIRDRRDGLHELAGIAHALLEQIGPSLGPLLEQLEREARVRVLAEDHDPHVGVALAQLGCDLNALPFAERGHADVADHHVGRLPGDRLRQRGAVLAYTDELDLFGRLEELGEALADEEAVLGDHDAQGHMRSVWRTGPRFTRAAAMSRELPVPFR